MALLEVLRVSSASVPLVLVLVAAPPCLPRGSSGFLRALEAVANPTFLRFLEGPGVLEVPQFQEVPGLPEVPEAPEVQDVQTCFHYTSHNVLFKHLFKQSRAEIFLYFSLIQCMCVFGDRPRPGTRRFASF